MATAGRTVFFSSLTVAAALASLLVFPQRFLYSMGLGGSLVALLAAAIALTVLPAVLALLGDAGQRPLARKFLQRRAEREARRHRGGLLVPALAVRQAPPDRDRHGDRGAADRARHPLLLDEVHLGRRPGAARGAASARQVDDVLRAEFPPFRDSPGPASWSRTRAPRTVAAVQRQLQGVDGIVAGEPAAAARERRRRASQAINDQPFIEPAAATLVEEVRGLPDPGGSEVLVTGAAASFVDFQESLDDHLPIAVGDHRPLDPDRALPDDGIGGAAGEAAADERAQPDGRLRDPRLRSSRTAGSRGLLDYRSQGALEQTMPILLFALAFGLSTDYGVFLLSRIKEARDAGASDSESVAIGLERTGRIVTAAAVLFAIAVGVFATSEIIFIKENFIGVALAVLIDASIIRALLVPALMELLGRWNWWAPKPLRRLHWRIGLSESTPA